MFACHGMEREENNFLPWKIDNSNGNIKDEINSSTKKDITKAPWLYQQHELGFNYRITDIQSALGTSQFKRIEETIKKRKKIFDIYQKAFDGHKNLLIPKEFESLVCAYHLYVIRYLGSDPNWRVKKILQLRENKIFAQIHYIPVYLQPWYQKNYDYSKIDCPNGDEYYNSCFSIPLYPDILDKDILKIIDLIKAD